ncbi:MAG: leucine-rich repeat domain-containing protein [Spirochaetia bacterium]|nr:leucine-rich repeat domain-containing protein [Spirochaetia bacterium]
MSSLDHLRSAYSRENLNRITTWLVAAYRGGDEGSVRTLFNSVRERAGLRHENEPGRIFAMLVKLYHPDKAQYYKNQIDSSEKGNETGDLSHILLALSTIEQCRITEQIVAQAEDDMEPYMDEEGGYDEADFDRYGEMRSDWEDELEEQDDQEEYARDFISALSTKEYGNLDMRYTKGILSSIEGAIDVSDYEIDDLAGVEYCTNITVLNLAHNRIEDLRKLEELTALEELYLSDNEISSVTPLAALESLKTLDLSYNQIEDITPLTQLHDLEYLNLIGNPVPQELLKLLRPEIIVIL